MARPLDTRIVNKAKLGDIRLTLNLHLAGTPGSEDPPVAPVAESWCQMATIEYALVDADGKHLGQRSITHQTAGVSPAPTLAQAWTAVGAQLRDWVQADRLALADNDAG